MQLQIMDENENYIVVVKPAGMPSQADKTGDLDLCTLLKRERGLSYVVPIHRLDRPVQGLIVYAKNEKSAAALSKQMVEGKFEKMYTAIVCGRAKESDELIHYLWKDERKNVSKVVQPTMKNAKRAILSYTLEERMQDDLMGQLSKIKISLETGRHHQIRVQLSHVGLPIFGDTKYNPLFLRNRAYIQIALYCSGLCFEEVVTHKKVTYEYDPK